MIKKNLFTIIGFKVVWLNCIIGEIYNNSLLGFFSGIIFLLCFIILQDKKFFIIKRVLIFSISGYFFDSFLSFFGFYRVNAQVNFLFLPIWFLVLWPTFCCLLIDVFSFLKNKKLLSTILGMIFGPLTYYAGVSSGLATIPSMYSFLIISIFWSSMMFAYSKYF